MQKRIETPKKTGRNPQIAFCSSTSYPEPAFPGRARNRNGCQACPQKKAVSKPDEKLK